MLYFLHNVNCKLFIFYIFYISSYNLVFRSSYIIVFCNIKHVFFCKEKIKHCRAVWSLEKTSCCQGLTDRNLICVQAKPFILVSQISLILMLNLTYISSQSFLRKCLYKLPYYLSLCDKALQIEISMLQITSSLLWSDSL